MEFLNCGCVLDLKYFLFYFYLYVVNVLCGSIEIIKRILLL